MMGQLKGVMILIGLSVLLAACMVTEDSPAPGCVRRIGFPMMGGCFGTTAIIDIVVDPAQNCLEVEADNCNGGVLEITNACSQDFVIGGVTVAQGDEVTFDVVSLPEGGYELVEWYSNFSEFTPDADTMLTFSGTLGSQSITITYTKTAPLCDE